MKTRGQTKGWSHWIFKFFKLFVLKTTSCLKLRKLSKREDVWIGCQNIPAYLTKTCKAWLSKTSNVDITNELSTSITIFETQVACFRTVLCEMRMLHIHKAVRFEKKILQKYFNDYTTTKPHHTNILKAGVFLDFWLNRKKDKYLHLLVCEYQYYPIPFLKFLARHHHYYCALRSTNGHDMMNQHFHRLVLISAKDP